MSPIKLTKPYGSWPSSISAELITRAAPGAEKRVAKTRLRGRRRRVSARFCSGNHGGAARAAGTAGTAAETAHTTRPAVGVSKAVP